MERAVLDQLADYFKSRLAGYPTTLAEDESMVLYVQILCLAKTKSNQLFFNNLYIALAGRW